MSSETTAGAECAGGLGVGRAQVTVDVTRRAPLRRIWRYAGYDEPNYTYTPNGRALLAKLAAMSDGPYAIRCHFLLCSGDGTPSLKWGSTNVYTEEADGTPIYDWTIIDRIFDTYAGLGLIPFVELGFTPQALTTAPADTPYADPRHGGWRYPPRDYGRWLELVRTLVAHCRDRYGRAAVSQWYWELWNEPDIFYWAGSVQEYCRLYDYTVAGLKAALPEARVGGPATTSSADRATSTDFLRAFLQHVTRGVNHLTGAQGTALDFISYHAKGGSFPRRADTPKITPSIYTLLNNVQASLAVVDEFPELAGCAVHLTECDPDGWAAGTIHDNANLFYRNTEYYASYVACTVCKLSRHVSAAGRQVDSMLTWAFLFEGRAYFEGFRTLSTNGVDKAVLNVFRLLAKLGGTRLALTSDRAVDPLSRGRGDDRASLPDIDGLAALDETNGIQVFLSSHHDDWDVTTPSEIAIRVEGVEPGRRYRVDASLVAKGSANAYTVWDAMGRPQPPSAEQLAAMQRAARVQPQALGEITAAADGLSLSLPLPSHSACLVQFVPVD
ncbi:MAG: beta-xylosidase [Chloroflexi bacterium]|nr:MAG: beta-xylosidase [Chloroflexota bacterium]